MSLLAVLLLQIAPPPLPTLTVYVASEAVDRVSRIHFGPGGAVVERVIPVDPRPSENDGPHNLNVSPDGRFWYVSVAHGTPNGSLWKFDRSTDSVIGIATLGRFPATISFSPDGLYAWVANFNLYGDMVPSSVSVVFTPTMTEVARVPTCLMPHGMRLNRAGTMAYGTCMMDDQVVEITPTTYKIARQISLGAAGHTGTAHAMTAPTCAPTWIQPTADGKRLYVACNRNAEVLELDAASLEVIRHIATGKTPYNLAISDDGRTLLATLKGQRALSVIDLVAGAEVAQLPTSHTVPSGVQITPDGRYAVVSQEGKGAEAGAVDLFDIPGRTRLATVEVGAGAGGIAIAAYAISQ